MINLFLSEVPTLQLHCGNAVAGDDSGRCQNPDCKGHGPATVGRLCGRCAVAKKLKACDIKPIRLTGAATSTPAGSAVPAKQ